MANTLTVLRIGLVAVIVEAALSRNGRIAGVALILAGATDFLDGYVARRAGAVSRFGARLDSVADFLLLISVAVSLQILRPEILRDNSALLAATTIVYATSIVAGVVGFRRLADPRQVPSKIAGGALYGFAVITLVSGAYEPLLLRLAALALAISSVEPVVAAVQAIQKSASARRPRSQAPQALNDVAIRIGAERSMATSTTPTASEIRR